MNPFNHQKTVLLFEVTEKIHMQDFQIVQCSSPFTLIQIKRVATRHVENWINFPKSFYRLFEEGKTSWMVHAVAIPCSLKNHHQYFHSVPDGVEVGFVMSCTELKIGLYSQIHRPGRYLKFKSHYTGSITIKTRTN